MKTALITTTVNVPQVLSLYRAYGPNARFFVALDQKTPEEAVNFCQYDVPNTHVLFIQDQQKWKCSELIGWNCIQRRNIALLEALKWGADIIVSIDDDNIPMNPDYFWHFEKRLDGRDSFNGLQAYSKSGWFDVGQLLQPSASHRGFPHDKIAVPAFMSVTGAKVGVVAGSCLGDPDISAATRIVNHPTVHGVSEVLRSGVITNPNDTWTVFNSQNTAFIRELAPAMFMLPAFGRSDDIYASLICQHVMRQKGLHVHFGPPFVWQQRNQHDLIKDLKAEILGMEHVVHLAGILDSMPTFAVDEMPARQIWRHLANVEWVPKQTVVAALAFCNDVEKVL